VRLPISVVFVVVAVMVWWWWWLCVCCVCVLLLIVVLVVVVRVVAVVVVIPDRKSTAVSQRLKLIDVFDFAHLKLSYNDRVFRFSCNASL